MSEHNHHHHHHGEVSGKKLLFTIVLNLIITIAEIVGGLLSGSLALLSDAVHNLSDTVSLALSAVAIKFAGKKPTKSFTFGYKRAEIMAAAFNSGSMLVIILFLIKEAVERFFNPYPIEESLMITVAVIGLAANLFSVLLLFKDSNKSLNIKSAYLHLMGDTLSSVAVVLGGIVIYFTGITWLDPLLTIFIALYILKETLHAFKESFMILMQSVPPDIDISEVKKKIEEQPEIENIHHIHVWNLDEKNVMLEAHATLCTDISVSETENIMANIKKTVHGSFGIEHVTLQFEYSGNCHKDETCFETKLS